MAPRATQRRRRAVAAAVAAQGVRSPVHHVPRLDLRSGAAGEERRTHTVVTAKTRTRMRMLLMTRTRTRTRMKKMRTTLATAQRCSAQGSRTMATKWICRSATSAWAATTPRSDLLFTEESVAGSTAAGGSGGGGGADAGRGAAQRDPPAAPPVLRVHHDMDIPATCGYSRRQNGRCHAREPRARLRVPPQRVPRPHLHAAARADALRGAARDVRAPGRAGPARGQGHERAGRAVAGVTVRASGSGARAAHPRRVRRGDAVRRGGAGGSGRGHHRGPFEARFAERGRVASSTRGAVGSQRAELGAQLQRRAAAVPPRSGAERAWAPRHR